MSEERTLTIRAIQENAWNAVELPIARDASRALLEHAAQVARQCMKEAERQAAPLRPNIEKSDEALALYGELIRSRDLAATRIDDIKAALRHPDPELREQHRNYLAPAHDSRIDKALEQARQSKQHARSRDMDAPDMDR